MCVNDPASCSAFVEPTKPCNTLHLVRPGVPIRSGLSFWAMREISLSRPSIIVNWWDKLRWLGQSSSLVQSELSLRPPDLLAAYVAVCCCVMTSWNNQKIASVCALSSSLDIRSRSWITVLNIFLDCICPLVSLIQNIVEAKTLAPLYTWAVLGCRPATALTSQSPSISFLGKRYQTDDTVKISPIFSSRGDVLYFVFAYR